MILLQLSSAQGPEECCLAVKKALDRLIKEATYPVDLSESVSASSWAQKLVSGHWAFYC